MNESERLERQRQRAYFWMRKATLAGLAHMGIHRDSPRTKQLWRIAQKAHALYIKAKEANK